jgi:hypothetical protein
VIGQLTLFDLPLPVDGWVYAMLMPSHAIKFGWTGRTPQRRAAELGGILIAHSPGTLEDEAMFHQRLDDWRIGRTEDFWPSPDVWCAVDVLRMGLAA